VAYRVEELAARAQTSVDTIRYYQARNLLPPPAHAGRVAWYDDEHLRRLARIRQLQSQGLSLTVIGRLLSGELDHADEALITAVAMEAGGSLPSPAGALEPGPPDEAPAWMTIEELAGRSGIPLAVLQAVAREGLLIAHRVAGEDRYSADDLEAAAAGLRLLEQGLPLPELLELAREHNAAVRATAERAVRLFDTYVRQALRARGAPEDVAAERLVSAFEEVLPATLTLVNHHFRRTLLAVAEEHITRVGSAGERQVVAVAAAAGGGQ
jgi:DNA-binding transcriptional MerR regulator